jgi:hypothetical protein
LDFTEENDIVSIKKSKRNLNGPVEIVFISRVWKGICPVVILERWMEKVASFDYIFEGIYFKIGKWYLPGGYFCKMDGESSRIWLYIQRYLFQD